VWRFCLRFVGLTSICTYSKTHPFFKKEIMKKEDKAFYGTSVGKGFIDFREYPSAYELRPTRVYVKEDGAINNQPSFAFLMEHPQGTSIAHPVFGQLSLAMLNDGLNDVGYTIRSQSDSVVIGEHIENCNIKELVDEQPETAHNPWNVLAMRVVKLCDNNGNEMTYKEVEEKGYAETWLEFPCFGRSDLGKCGCVKRVRIKAITQM